MHGRHGGMGCMATNVGIGGMGGMEEVWRLGVHVRHGDMECMTGLQ